MPRTSNATMINTTVSRQDRKPDGSTSFQRKRDLILDAATVLVNQRGLAGMTFAEVARSVDLTTTSITYYFRLKEQLAAAVFEHTLGRLEAMTVEAGSAPDPRARVATFLQLHFNLRARVLRGEERDLAVLSDIRTLDEPIRAPLAKHYMAIFRRICAFFGPLDEEARSATFTARAQMLTETVFWLPAWIHHYSVSDFDRVRLRLFDMLSNGIAQENDWWTGVPRGVLDTAHDLELDSSRGNFLRAATRLVNERGYRGASVDRVAAELKVTKGSFYHHLDAKDDLVLECFRRSYQRVSRAQRLALQSGGSQWQQLAACIAMLLDVQFDGEWPLLRTTALQALPSELRTRVVERSNRLALRFAGMLMDGIIDGSIRPVDPMITSQVLLSTLNAAYDLRDWGRALPNGDAVRIYASTLSDGLFGAPATRPCDGISPESVTAPLHPRPC